MDLLQVEGPSEVIAGLAGPSATWALSQSSKEMRNRVSGRSLVARSAGASRDEIDAIASHLLGRPVREIDGDDAGRVERDMAREARAEAERFLVARDWMRETGGRVSVVKELGGRVVRLHSAHQTLGVFAGAKGAEEHSFSFDTDKGSRAIVCRGMLREWTCLNLGVFRIAQMEETTFTRLGFEALFVDIFQHIASRIAARAVHCPTAFAPEPQDASENLPAPKECCPSIAVASAALAAALFTTTVPTARPNAVPVACALFVAFAVRLIDYFDDAHIPRAAFSAAQRVEICELIPGAAKDGAGAPVHFFIDFFCDGLLGSSAADLRREPALVRDVNRWRACALALFEAVFPAEHTALTKRRAEESPPFRWQISGRRGGSESLGDAARRMLDSLSAGECEWLQFQPDVPKSRPLALLPLSWDLESVRTGWWTWLGLERGSETIDLLIQEIDDLLAETVTAPLRDARFFHRVPLWTGLCSEVVLRSERTVRSLADVEELSRMNVSGEPFPGTAESFAASESDPCLAAPLRRFVDAVSISHVDLPRANAEGFAGMVSAFCLFVAEQAVGVARENGTDRSELFDVDWREKVIPICSDGDCVSVAAFEAPHSRPDRSLSALPPPEGGFVVGVVRVAERPEFRAADWVEAREAASEEAFDRNATRRLARLWRSGGPFRFVRDAVAYPGVMSNLRSCLAVQKMSARAKFELRSLLPRFTFFGAPVIEMRGLDTSRVDGAYPPGALLNRLIRAAANAVRNEEAVRKFLSAVPLGFEGMSLDDVVVEIGLAMSDAVVRAGGNVRGRRFYEQLATSAADEEWIRERASQIP